MFDKDMEPEWPSEEQKRNLRRRVMVIRWGIIALVVLVILLIRGVDFGLLGLLTLFTLIVGFLAFGWIRRVLDRVAKWVADHSNPFTFR